MPTIAAFGTCFGPTGNRGQGSSNRESVWQKFVVDFTADNTSIGTDLDIFAADHAMLIEQFYADTETAVVSAQATSTFSIGVGSSGTHLIDTVGMSTFSIGTLIGPNASLRMPIKLSRGQKVVMTKAGAGGSPTAGKLHLNFKVSKLTNY